MREITNALKNLATFTEKDVDASYFDASQKISEESVEVLCQRMEIANIG